MIHTVYVCLFTERSRTSTMLTEIMPQTVIYCYSYLPKNTHVQVTFFMSKKKQKDARIAEHWNDWNCKGTKTHLLPFWDTDQKMRCKIPLTKILNWIAGCELWSGPPDHRSQGGAGCEVCLGPRAMATGLLLAKPWIDTSLWLTELQVTVWFGLVNEKHSFSCWQIPK